MLNAYVYCWISSCFFAYQASHVKRKSMMFFYSFMAVIIPVMMAALRDLSVGIDIWVYGLPGYTHAMAVSSFEEFAPAGIFSMESGWALITYFSTKIFESIHWNFFFYSLVSVGCFYIGAWRYRNTVSLWLVMLLYFLLHYNNTYNLMRQSMACSVIFMGIATLEERHYSRFILYIIAALFFHSSAILCVIYILLIHWMITSPKAGQHERLLVYGSMVFLVVAGEIMLFMATHLPLPERYRTYALSFGAATATHTGFYGVGWERLLMTTGEAIIFMLYAPRGKKLFAAKWKGGVGMFEYFRYVVFFMIFFRIGVSFFDRLLLYLEYVNVLILATLHKFVKERNLRTAVFLAVIGAAFLVWWHFFVLKGRISSGTWPYRSILSQ